LFLLSFLWETLMIQRREKVIFDDTCSPPCWRNIIPGKTTSQEAYDLISGFSDKKTGKVNRWGDYGQFNAYYDFTLSSGVRVWISTIDDVVALVEFSDHDDNGIATFGMCVSRYGTPEYAAQSIYSSFGLPIGPTQTWHILFNALNPQKGVSYGFDTYTYFGSKKSVSPGSKIIVINYFDTEQFDILLQSGWLLNSADDTGHDINDLHPWVGYGNIFELYPYEPASP